MREAPLPTFVHPELVANPIEVDHQASVLGGFCFHVSNGRVLKFASTFRWTVTLAFPNILKHTSQYSSLVLRMISTIDASPWLGPKAIRRMPLLLMFHRAATTLLMPGCCGSLKETHGLRRTPWRDVVAESFFSLQAVWVPAHMVCLTTSVSQRTHKGGRVHQELDEWCRVL